MSTKMNLNGGLTRAFGRGKLYATKFGPEILLGVGIVSGLIGAYYAAKVTEAARQEVEETKTEIDRLNRNARW